jgi:hypothetical protein
MTETTAAAVVTTTTSVIGVVPPATAPVTTFTTPVLNSGSTYSFAVTATTLAGTTVAATTGLNNSPTVAPVAFNGIQGTAKGTIVLNWANSATNVNNVSGIKLSWSDGTTTTSHIFAPTTTGATVGAGIGVLTTGTAYTFTLQALSNVAAFNSPTIGMPLPITAP